MARLIFTQQLARFVSAPQIDTTAPTLRAALDGAFAAHAQLGHYVLDEQGHLRDNVVVFIDGQRVRDRVALGEALGPDSTVHILQALSGG